MSWTYLPVIVEQAAGLEIPEESVLTSAQALVSRVNGQLIQLLEEKLEAPVFGQIRAQVMQARGLAEMTQALRTGCALCEPELRFEEVLAAAVRQAFAELTAGLRLAGNGES